MAAQTTLFLLVVVVTRVLAESDLDSSSEDTTLPKKPHIIYMFGDDIGWNDVSWHNGAMITPNLQKLADEGVILENFYAMAACVPSRTALMTGFYPSRKVTEKGVPVPLKTLPETLEELGYKICHFGDQYMKFNRGKVVNIYRHALYRPRDGNRCLQDEGTCVHGHPNDADVLHLEDTAVLKPSIDINNTVFSTPYISPEEIIECIENHNKSNPMFLFVTFKQTHDHLNPAPSIWGDMYAETVPDITRRNFSGKVTLVDSLVGAIRTKLEEKGMFEDSLIIYQSDNGGDCRYGGSNWPFRGGKCSYMEGGIKVNAFITGKGIKKGGYVNHELYFIADMFPTLVESVAKGTIDYDIDGINIWNSLSMGLPSPREEFLLVSVEEHPFDANLTAIRYRDWKFMEGIPSYLNDPHLLGCAFEWQKTWRNGSEVISNPDANDTTTWLFNLRTDPYEMHNLADKNPIMVKYLHDKVEAYRDLTNQAILSEKDPQSNRCV